MKVVGFNGSPNKKGNTACSLNMVFEELENAGIETEMIQVGKKKIQGCTACHDCVKKQNEACSFDDDPVNEWIQKIKAADGILLGSPVHFSGVAGTMKSFLDRAFFVASVNGGLFRNKVGAAVAAVRRSGGISTVDSLNHYINYSEMVMPSSNYWNVAHGLAPGEMRQDGEGKQIMAVLGKNMAWIMKIIEHGKVQFPAPEPVTKTMTNFIR
ncbi:flavodoxin family protein [Desulfobacter hydrogenophilus]|uniref:Flavodoxin family protein n=1 Tax=Desulfobacter hydrogenophilus TaxID=2291 RepID=A0A328FDH3_9BACT|nr:flavodoxin family protein [Desulfobacter hydrogenophilus]NDY71710.1 flavodoxin family protein [Desulfobacter hydrogenophilus]QBH13218.1 flavodoxin family protein [Desulfobacter hydrogenophilus]RAM02359.1 flavodoxin family protein [Desulfobacter hydrogenophilus]